MEKVNFLDCTIPYLDATFQLEQQTKLDVLTDWLNVDATVSEREKEQLLSLQEFLRLHILHWNEQELSLNFIGPIFSMLRFNHQAFNFFAQRQISGIIDDIELYGKVDGMIASGFSYPKAPFFSFHEFKKEIDPTGDPIGQNLASMLVGHALNEHQLPIYGCFINGQNWYFMALDEKKYAISRGFSPNSDELFDIFRMLKGLKAMIVASIDR